MYNCIIANLSWNHNSWRTPTVNPKAGHSYAREFPGHESVNFKFTKKGIDTDKKVYGFVQWKNPPIKFKKGGTVIFYSNNTELNVGEIVGIYCNVEILKERVNFKYKGFQNNTLESNMVADKSLSMLFPIPLLANKYKKPNQKRLVGQVGYTYYENNVIERIVLDEINAIRNEGYKLDELAKLIKIFEFITEKRFNFDNISEDEFQQNDLIDYYLEDKDSIADDLISIKGNEEEEVFVNLKKYKRNNKTIAQLKIYRNFSCQICGEKIRKKDKGFYIEAAHIKPKCKKGCETPDNLMILCPNHHKEFDYGDVEIIKHTKDYIEFSMNEEFYNVDLSIK